jgi:hypothetical protein
MVQCMFTCVRVYWRSADSMIAHRGNPCVLGCRSRWLSCRRHCRQWTTGQPLPACGTLPSSSLTLGVWAASRCVHDVYVPAVEQAAPRVP